MDRDESSSGVPSDVDVDDSLAYPFDSLLPKQETQALKFLSKFPNYDGRCVTIAVLDTGIDPAAHGLHKTTLETPKIVDVIDCTGAGDVDTSVVKTVDSDGFIIGLSGRKLKIPADWANPSGKFHLGIKNVFDLYPKVLKTRVIKERKEKSWDPMHRLAVADLSRQMEAFEKEHGLEPTEITEKSNLENIKASLGILDVLEKNFKDEGPVMDCLVFNDGKKWKACIDTSYCGQLIKCKVMGSFREAQEFSQLTCIDCLTYSFNFYDNGNLLEIATTSGSHGTHVASIAAAYFPETPQRNGVAAGAQILSLGIGDRRLGSMETGCALTRAINICIERKVDLINYSFGETSHFTEYGPICRAIEEAVYKHNITFVASASNDGPALSSVAAPGASLDACISVAAYVSPPMMSAMYALRDKLPGDSYSWSSRGPCPDGGMGLCVTGPGAAITSVPRWTLNASQLMNGTSMSSPNVAGCIACLISALKAEQIPYSPISIKRALEFTASSEPNLDCLSTGFGMVQIHDAFEHLIRNQKNFPKDVNFVVTCSDRRGIYLREKFELDSQSKEYSINVKPVFNDTLEHCEKLNCEWHFNLECDKSWISLPKTFCLSNYERSFSIKLDVSKFEPNSVHFAMVKAFDAQHPETGFIWYFPITVIVPECLEKDGAGFSLKVSNLHFRPGMTHRRFIHVPDGAEWASLKFQSSDLEHRNQFCFHALQLFPDRSRNTTESFKVAHLPQSGETTQNFVVISNRTLELCLAKWWSSQGDAQASFELNFKGLTPLNRHVTMRASDDVKRVYFESKILSEEVSPAISMQYLCKPMKPTSAKITALGSRDLFQDGKQIYSLILNYEFNVKDKSDIFAVFPSWAHYLYEQELNCFLFMIFTDKKQYLQAGGAYPYRYSHSYEPGNYLLRVQLRHEDKSLLEKSQDLALVLKFKLAKPVNLNCYPTWKQAVTRGKKFDSVHVNAGAVKPIYITLAESLPKIGATVGCRLSGKMTLSKNEAAKAISKHKFTYFIDCLEKESKTTTSSENAKEDSKKDVEEKFNEAMRDLKMSWLSKLPEKKSMELYKELKVSFPDHPELNVAQIKALTERGKSKHRDEIIDLADSILEVIDPKQLLQYFGMKNDLNEDSEKQKKKMTSRLNLITEAFVAKGTAISEFILQKVPIETVPKTMLKGLAGKNQTKQENLDKAEADISKQESNDGEQKDTSISENETEAEKEKLEITSTKYTLNDIDLILVELMKFCSKEDSGKELLIFRARHAVLHENYGRALQLLQMIPHDKWTKDIDVIVSELYEKLGWIHAMEYQKNAILVKYPPTYRLF